MDLARIIKQLPPSPEKISAQDKPKLFVPKESTVLRWISDGKCRAVDGCWTEPDGYCEHGKPSWAIKYALI